MVANPRVVGQPLGLPAVTSAPTQRSGALIYRSDLAQVQVSDGTSYRGLTVARVQTLTDAATVTPGVDAYDGGILTTLSQATTIANPTGTPVQFQHYVLRIKSSAPRALTWGTAYRGGTDLALPTTTTGASKTDYIGFQYNVEDAKWDIIALARGY